MAVASNDRKINEQYTSNLVYLWICKRTVLLLQLRLLYGCRELISV